MPLATCQRSPSKGLLFVYLPVSPFLGIARLLGNMAIGSIRFDGLSLDGTLEGSSRSRSPGFCSMASLEGLSFGAYCGGGPVQEKNSRENMLNSIPLSNCLEGDWLSIAIISN